MSSTPHNHASATELERLTRLRRTLDERAREVAVSEGRVAQTRKAFSDAVARLRALGAKGSKPSEVLRSARELLAQRRGEAQGALSELEGVLRASEPGGGTE